MCEVGLVRSGWLRESHWPRWVRRNWSSILLPMLRLLQPPRTRPRARVTGSADCGSFFTPEQLTVDQVAQAMDGQQVHFLDACGDLGGARGFHVFRQQQRGHAATVAAGERLPASAVMGGLDGLDDVGRVTAGGDRQQHVAGLAEGRPDLLGEHPL